MSTRHLDAGESEAVAAFLALAMPWAWNARQVAGTLESPAGLGLALEEVPAAGFLGVVLLQAAAGEAEVLVLAVREDRRRHGLGRALFDAGLAAVRERGAGVLRLEVRADNVAALALYGAAGCVEEGRRRRYYPDGEDAVTLRLGPWLVSS